MQIRQVQVNLTFMYFLVESSDAPIDEEGLDYLNIIPTPYREQCQPIHHLLP